MMDKFSKWFAKFGGLFVFIRTMNVALDAKGQVAPIQRPTAPLLLQPPAASPARPRQQQYRLAPMRGEASRLQVQQSNPALILQSWRKALNGGR